eukprot:863430-Pyramimonas_sp.AAC.1
MLGREARGPLRALARPLRASTLPVRVLAGVAVLALPFLKGEAHHGGLVSVLLLVHRVGHLKLDPLDLEIVEGGDGLRPLVEEAKGGEPEGLGLLLLDVLEH